MSSFGRHRRLEQAGLLEIGTGCQLSPDVVFQPADLTGTSRPVVLGDRCRVQGRACLHGGVRLGDGAVIEDLAIVGAPEHGYAVGLVYPGDGGTTELASGTIVRAGAVLYAGTSLGEGTTIGHYTVVRSLVRIGSNSQLAHHLVVERETTVGDYVRCSPLSHITSRTVLEDRVFLGAGVVTINDKSMIWRQPDAQPTLQAPHVEFAATVGSGSTLAAGVRIGQHAMIGSGSVVLRDVPAHAVAYGVPARIQRPEGASRHRGSAGATRGPDAPAESLGFDTRQPRDPGAGFSARGPLGWTLET